MAPRKRVDKSVKNTEEKVNKKGKKKIIHGNAPSIIRVEIPTSSSSTTGMKTSKARVVTSQKLKAPSASSNKISKPRIVTNPNLSKNEIKVMLANEVVEAHFSKKCTDNICEATILPPKRKIIPKKMMDGRIAVTKKIKPGPTASIDSDGPAFEEASEPKQPKSRSKCNRKIQESPSTPDAEIVKNGAVKRRHPNSGINKTNPKVKRIGTENSNVNAQDERKPQRRIGNAKKKIITDVCNNKDIPIGSKQSVEEDTNKNPGRVRIRKPSNESECLSWTKDISSSSTTTCITVSTNEYVCLDNRVPLIQLTNICKQLHTENLNGIKVDSSMVIKNTEDVKNVQEPRDSRSVSRTPSRSRSLSLSSSSSSSNSDSDDCSDRNKLTPSYDALDEAIEKLTSNLRKFDAEIIKWIGYDSENPNGIKRNAQSKVLEVLKEESDVITTCRNIKKLLLDEPQYCDNDDSWGKDKKDEDFVKSVELKTDEETTKDNAFKNITDDGLKDISGDLFDDRCNDDDDALSLYAESISGFDSCRKSTSISNEEYIPQPVSKTVEHTQSVIYMPTKITESSSNEDNELGEPPQKTKSICEKQNADSTSIYKDPKYSDELTNSGGTYEQTFQNLTPVNSKKPILMSSMYDNINCVKSVVFGGVCFFNLILSCKKTRCRFVHAYIDFDVIKLRLTQANEEMFIKEYMLMRNWPILRRKYGLLFVSEALNRELTRIAIEMAMDFVTKTSPHVKEDIILKVEVLEQVLLYLNKVDISTYSDLLLFNIKNGECICDIFMKTLAETQNFSRFKTIFVNLTNFMYKNDRQFNLDVVTLLLERVCILPFEEALILALLNILRRTPPDILQNSMIPHFEKSLSSHKHLLMQLQEIKSMTLSSRDYRVVTPTPHYDLDQTNPMMLGELDKRCSPDTTNFDHLTKTHKESIMSPAIDTNRAWLFDQSRGLLDCPVSSVPLLKNNNIEHRKQIQVWNNRNMLNKVIMVPNINASTSSIRPERKSDFIRQLDKRQKQYGASPTKYVRRFGPDFL